MRQLRGIHAALGATLALALAGPAVAQDAAPATSAATVPAAPATTNSSDAIGPAQLRGFSLNGTVTREAAPVQAPAQPTRTATTTARPDNSAGAVAQRGEAPASRAQRAETSASSTAPAVAASPGFQLPAPAPAERPTPASAFAETLPASVLPSVDPAESAAALSGGFPLLPWLLAALLLGGALWYFRIRPRSRLAFAGGPEFDSGPAVAEPRPQPQPQPAPQPLPRTMAGDGPPATAAPPVAGGGIVSTRLRPWLDIAIVPGRAVFSEAGMTVEFELLVRNTGAAPARDVLLEAAMFNAGPEQDQQIGTFFEFPNTRGDRFAQMMPLQQIAVASAVTLPLAEMRQFELQGRKLFVPLLAVNAVYRWSAGEGQTSASYLIGRDGKGEKMAPLRLDQGPRLFRGLGAREHQARIRK